MLAAAPFQSIAPAGNPNAACPAANCLGGGLSNANDRAIARLSRTGSRLMNNDSVAVFVHGTYTFTPAWSLTVGMRQSWEQKEFTYNEIYPLLPVPFTDPGPNRANDNPSFPLTTLSDEWDVFTPKLGVEFKPKRDVLVYVQGSTGFKAGGFNGRPSPLTGLAPFGSEEIANDRDRLQERMVRAARQAERRVLLQQLSRHPDLAAVTDRPRRARRGERG